MTSQNEFNERYFQIFHLSRLDGFLYLYEQEWYKEKKVPE